MNIIEFELAFNLCDEAIGRIYDQSYGIHQIPWHNHGDVLLTTVHHHDPRTGHRLVLLAHDNHGLVAAIEAGVADLHDDDADPDATPHARILKVRAGNLTFHAQPDNQWIWTARSDGHTYQLAAATGDELLNDNDPLWTIRIDDHDPIDYDALDDAIADLTDHHHRAAA